MALSLTYPGVYVQELPSAVRAITGVATSITAFVGRAWRGSANQPVRVSSYTDYVRQFGGLWRASSMSYAVQQFFANGGSEAIIVRVTEESASAAHFVIPSETDSNVPALPLEAANAGSWGRNLVITVDYTPNGNSNLFNLTVVDPLPRRDKPGKDSLLRGGTGQQERFLNLSLDPTSPRYVVSILAQQSQLVRVSVTDPAFLALPAAGETVVDGDTGLDGEAISDTDLIGDTNSGSKTGLFALENTDVFNLLCIPPLDPDNPDNSISLWSAAATYCKSRRALLIVDAPADWSVGAGVQAMTGTASFTAIGDRDYAALYFPRVLLSDPLQEGNLQEFAPCGVVAGICARTDTERGVWKAPAGIEANMAGVMGLAVNHNTGNLTEAEIGQLNPLGVNCLRGMPVIGNVIWGARTLDGADALASQWKYVPVRRLALFIEESLFRGTQWVVFEPNDEPLWAQVRLNVGAFMQTLFRQGAFQGASPREAYFVKCGSETTTQTDIDNGIVNIVVGFAPLKPAEFVVLQIQQITPQS